MHFNQIVWQFSQIYLNFPDLQLTGWCQLAYWELSERVGSKVPVEDPAVDVFGEQTRGTGLCIKTIAQQRSTRTPELVLKTREKIGLGKLKKVAMTKIKVLIEILFQE